ncbi:hypothetical protein KP509_29G076000 [Ceratopteris richardii]|uniref:Uncharacterized protein n=1 Tax=Ceratopteris richardii TaxID=49495 RepID=A0A8T2RAM4_CERRI|nr:hypothetical protein KP509_29G076000 [Ceratopteris richardii]
MDAQAFSPSQGVLRVSKSYQAPSQSPMDTHPSIVKRPIPSISRRSPMDSQSIADGLNQSRRSQSPMDPISRDGLHRDFPHRRSSLLRDPHLLSFSSAVVSF